MLSRWNGMCIAPETGSSHAHPQRALFISHPSLLDYVFPAKSDLGRMGIHMIYLSMWLQWRPMMDGARAGNFKNLLRRSKATLQIDISTPSSARRVANVHHHAHAPFPHLASLTNAKKSLYDTTNNVVQRKMEAKRCDGNHGDGFDGACFFC